MPGCSGLLTALIALIFCLISFRLRLLTAHGAVAAFFVGWTVFSLGGLAGSIPVVTFFVASNLLARLRSAFRAPAQIQVEEQHNNRNARQVLANGVIPSACIIIWSFSGKPVAFVLFVAAIASATSDTWATELGMASRATPRSIVDLKPVRAGASGGVTVMGLVGAFTGAILIVLVSQFSLYLEYSESMSGAELVVVTLAAFLGQAIDSLLGGLLQARWTCPRCGAVTEMRSHCDEQTEFRSGLAWLDNDLVNLFSILIGVLIAWLGLHFFN